ncbi:hypothetical protein ASE36_06585 [Rhizobium sp. Root274]|uniref:molybdopterin-dependent oxidoreductase n=1 Tax=unclassified Rhizobium TaxID=2613769 RepID=UPI0007142DCE|nr:MULTISPECIES: molybdopterin-dependent oxidoreductase [unclassified Rhizobium]KQW31876.1 hypothetical protein ASC71_06600 [Rhizobium sp. Root1240]KRD33414.1 hypothetical protein ASE36_06585 [Rhizobium sp. Root274]
MKGMLLALLLGAVSSTSALALDAPTGPVVLTVKGAITNTNAGNTAEFDLAMLEALAGRKATMETPWTDGKVTFEGPLLSALLEAVGSTGTLLSVKALNDYAAEVPAEDAKLATMLATRMDGKPMSVRDKGPLMIVYPFDQNPDLYNEKYFSRSVWQIKEIEVSK